METELSKMNILRLSNEESNRVTKEALQTALFKLMGKMPFEKITISDLCKRAGVSRAAFYRNYETKEELREEICRYLFSKMTASLQSELLMTDRKAWYANFFRGVKDNKEAFQMILDAKLPITDRQVAASNLSSASGGDRYLLVAHKGAFFSILMDWYRSGMNETPEEMGETCDRVLGLLGKGGMDS